MGVLVVCRQLEETLTPTLSLLKEGRGRRFRRAGRALNSEANAHGLFLLPLLATKRGEGRGEEFRLNRYGLDGEVVIMKI